MNWRDVPMGKHGWFTMLFVAPTILACAILGVVLCAVLWPMELVCGDGR